jgi:phosphoribosylaminoimidazolecarboxamide formyltransferase/IMP cyclohydrolase
MNVGVLASGSGTNLQALLDRVHGRDGITIAAVASDKPGAYALERAAAAGVPTSVFPIAAFAGDRAARDAAIADWLVERGVELVVLAGYMQLLTTDFLARFEGRVINVHPALLPAFPGLAAVQQALDYGVKVFGVTVHFVDDGVDTGAVILQRAIELPDATDADAVLERLHPIEHELLPEAVRLIARGAVRLHPEHPRRVIVDRGSDAIHRDSESADLGRVADAMQQDTESAPLPPVAPGEVQIARALLSVSDKTGIVEFARGLADLGVEIISTGGTARELETAGIPVRSISDLTGFPEIMDGRVKTLHPKLYAGLLAVRDNPEHLSAAQEQEVEFVDLVCVNLYPFERTAATRGVTDDEVVENIDIGGPTMIRAAAKNAAFAAPIVSPASYDAILDELRESDRRLSSTTRESLAAEAFAYTARYDTAIARWFQEKREDFPPLMVRAFEKVLELPYGENPHQRAAYYAQVGARTHVLSMVSQLGGKALSFNNLLDLDSARLLLSEFKVPGCVIVKHNNPCGVAVAPQVLEAYQRAFACDPMSAFGGVIAINRRVDKALAEAIVGQFVEVLFARGYDDDALEVLSTKPNMRILDDRERRSPNMVEPHLHQVVGGMLIQDRDADLEDRSEMQVVSERRPTEEEWQELLFSWRVCKHVRSNAIVLARDLASVGIGAGQMSRVDSVRLALEKAQSEIAGCVLASDAYFPFADGPELALEAGVTAIIQPGGSVRDPEVVEAIDKAGAAMVFTSRRHFRH